MERRIYTTNQMPKELIFRESAVYNKIFAPDNDRSTGMFYGHTSKLHRIVRDLLGSNEADRQAVFLKSHIHRVRDDAIELRYPGLRAGIALYANNKNELYFSLLNTLKYHADVSGPGHRPKIKSSGNNLKDAEMVRRTLEDFVSKLNVEGVVVDGPNDLERLVVMMKESAFPIARSNGVDLLGLVLQPKVDINSFGVGGEIKLLLRSR